MRKIVFIKFVRCIAVILMLCTIIFECIGCKDQEVLDTNDTAVLEEDFSGIYFWDYTIIRADNSSDVLMDEITGFYSVLTEASDHDNIYSIDSDAFYYSEKEILVGHTNRIETQNVIPQISENEYVIAVIGSKIVILGYNDTVTAIALRYFADNYIVNNENGTIPSGLFYKAVVSEAEMLKFENQKNYVFIDTNVEHKFIATDIINYSLVVFDLNLCDGNFQRLADDSAIVWEWKSREDPNCKFSNKIIRSISGVKFRYSEYYQKEVVIACANFGWVGVIDYENCSLIWECELPTGPHSVEMLPNGDVIVASAADDGALIYIPLSVGVTEPTHSIVSPSCHGVSWDNESKCLWVLELNGIYACKIENMGTNAAKLVRVEGSGDTFKGDKGGHALAKITGETGKYWVSAINKLWIFDTKTQTLTVAPSKYSKKNIKGICSFVDGTVIESIAGLYGNNKYSWGSDGFIIITKDTTTDQVNIFTDVSFKKREFYKIQTFTKDY